MWDPLRKPRSRFNSKKFPPDSTHPAHTQSNPVKPISIPASLLLTSLLALAPACLAAETDPCATSSTTSEVQFTLALSPTQSTFRQGELIRLTLSFASTTKSRYSVDDKSYDRSGRLDIETYCLQPQAPDPLESYFNSVGAIIGGGLFSIRPLDAAPFLAHAELNEFRTLAPGHYHLYAVSHRVHRPPGPQDDTSNNQVSETLRSNTVDLVILPATREWQRRQLQSALESLAYSSSPPTSASSDTSQQAARQLRFLNTRESTRALARLFAGRDPSEPYGWEFAFGLFGSPYRQIAIQTLRQQIAIPTHPISEDFIRTLVQLEISADPSDQPPVSSNPPSPSEQTAMDAVFQRRRMREEELTKDVLSALPHKTGRARAITALGLVSSRLVDPALAPAIAEELRKILLASWEDLPVDTRDTLIQYQWAYIGGPDMIPVLLKIAAEHPKYFGDIRADAREVALRRLAQLDPEAARPFLVKELIDPSTRLTFATLKLLPADEIAAAMPSAIARIAQNTSRPSDFALIDHFAGAADLSSVQAAWDQAGSKSVCGETPGLLRYFLRVAPEYGASQVDAALHRRTGKDFCYRQLLQALGDQIPAAESVAISALNDPEPDVQQDAVIALTRWGTAAAEAPLVARLERLHEEWAGRAAELDRSPSYETPAWHAAALEQALCQGLAGSAAWLATPEKLARLKSLALVAQDRNQIESYLELWKDHPRGPFLISPTFLPDQKPTFSLLQCSPDMTEDQLHTKLAQLPRGTRLIWQFWAPGHIDPPLPMDIQDAAFERIRAVATQHGLTLEKQDHP
jgi:hypothetical protein